MGICTWAFVGESTDLKDHECGMDWPVAAAPEVRSRTSDLDIPVLFKGPKGKKRACQRCTA